MTEGQLEARWPDTQWRRPIPITVGADTRLGCRLCIAIVGVRARDFRRLAKTLDEFEKHMREAHPQR